MQMDAKDFGVLLTARLAGVFASQQGNTDDPFRADHCNLSRDAPFANDVEQKLFLFEGNEVHATFAYVRYSTDRGNQQLEASEAVTTSLDYVR